MTDQLRRDQFTQAQFLSVQTDLKEHHRVVLAAAFSGDSQQTIADNLKLPVGTVKTRAMRGLRQMKKLLDRKAASALERMAAEDARQ